jgi:hypothetical protein
MQICNTLARAMRRFFLLAQSRNFRESTRHKRPPHFVLSPSSDRRTRGAIDSVLGAIGEKFQDYARIPASSDFAQRRHSSTPTTAGPATCQRVKHLPKQRGRQLRRGQHC